MRTYEEYKQILSLWQEDVNKKAISRITGIPRGTVRGCIEKFGNLETLEAHAREAVEPILLQILHNSLSSEHEHLYQAYAYLLGIYLGDGCITKGPRAYRLRVSLDAKYPGIIDTCAKSIQTLLPENIVGYVENWYQGHVSHIDVSCWYKHWPALLPQHDSGRKHERAIQLEAWQTRIVSAYPLLFWKGLYHSDGSRFNNVVKGKAYPRYQFTNSSEDIIRLFCDASTQLGLQWTSKERPPRNGVSQYDIFISKRKDVEFLDREIGPKQ